MGWGGGGGGWNKQLVHTVSRHIYLHVQTELKVKIQNIKYLTKSKGTQTQPNSLEKLQNSSVV